MIVVQGQSERLGRQLKDSFSKNGVHLDALYMRNPEAIDRPYCRYEQIYADFGLDAEDESGRSLLFVSALELENDDIRERDGEALLFEHNGLEEVVLARGIAGREGGNRQRAPLTLLVPHLRCTGGNQSLSMINVSTVIENLLVTAAFPEEQHSRERRDSDDPALPSASGGVNRDSSCEDVFKRKGLVMMTCTTIKPKNEFKRMLNETQSRVLDQSNTNWQYAFANVSKHRLFALKHFSTHKVGAARRVKERHAFRSQVQLALSRMRDLLNLALEEGFDEAPRRRRESMRAPVEGQGEQEGARHEKSVTYK